MSNKNPNTGKGPNVSSNKNTPNTPNTPNAAPGKGPQTNAPGKGSPVPTAGKPDAGPPADAAAPAAPADAAGKPDAPADGSKPSKKKRERVRLVSPSNSKLWCRMFKDVMDANGKPRDADGKEWEVKKGASFGMSAEERAKRAEAKKAEEARIAAMTPEEKTAFLRKKREDKNAAKSQKLEAERASNENRLRIGVYLDLLGKGIDIRPLTDALEQEGQDVSLLRQAIAAKAAGQPLPAAPK